LLGRSGDPLPDVLPDSLQRCDILSQLLLPGGELLYAAPHGVEILRQGRKLLRQVRGSCSHGSRRLRLGGG
jgi:hypothetical protein